MLPPPAPPIAIAGAGRLAQALGHLLLQHGQPVVAMAGRDPARTAAAAAFVGSTVQPAAYRDLARRASRLILAVPDDAIPAVAALLAETAAPGGLALHTSGVLDAGALAPLAAAGLSCAALHPLQTIASPEQGLAALPGAAFAISGDGPARQWAESIAALLDGRVLAIRPGCRPLYHAAAVLAGNCITGLLDAAARLMAAAGVEERPALEALAPLARASLENTLALGPERALTGPVQRADHRTVALHLNALAAAPASIDALYRSASLHLVELARRSNPAAPLGQLEHMLRTGPEHHD